MLSKHETGTENNKRSIDIMRMPGLPKQTAAVGVELLPDGTVFPVRLEATLGGRH